MYLIDKFHVYRKLHPEFEPFMQDLLRTLTIQVVAQLLFSLSNPTVSFLNSTFIQTSIYLCVGVAAFWLVVYKYLLSKNVLKSAI